MAKNKQRWVQVQIDLLFSVFNGGPATESLIESQKYIYKNHYEIIDKRKKDKKCETKYVFKQHTAENSRFEYICYV